MPLTPAQLNAEFTTDPQAYGYRTFVSVTEGGTLNGPTQDQQLADLINFARNGVAPCPVNNVVGPAVTIRKGSVPTKDVLEAVNIADFSALPTNPNAAALSVERRQLAYLTAIAALDELRILNNDGTNAPPAVVLLAMFPPGSATRDRLITLATRNGSRAEALGGEGTIVSVAAVGLAFGRG